MDIYAKLNQLEIPVIEVKLPVKHIGFGYDNIFGLITVNQIPINVGDTLYVSYVHEFSFGTVLDFTYMELDHKVQYTIKFQELYVNGAKERTTLDKGEPLVVKTVRQYLAQPLGFKHDIRHRLAKPLLHADATYINILLSKPHVEITRETVLNQLIVVQAALRKRQIEPHCWIFGHDFEPLLHESAYFNGTEWHGLPVYDTLDIPPDYAICIGSPNIHGAMWNSDHHINLMINSESFEVCKLH